MLVPSEAIELENKDGRHYWALNGVSEEISKRLYDEIIQFRIDNTEDIETLKARCEYVT